MAKSKLAKYRARRKRQPNPEAKAVKDMAYNIGAGFAGYSATRLLARIAYSQVVKRWPKASQHAHVAASALSATGVYFGTKHWSKVDDYHEAAVIGAGIALLQTAIQTYIPKFGWIVADVDAAQYAPKKNLPDADLGALETPQEEEGIFDLDLLLAENPDVEAVSIGQTEPEPAIEVESTPALVPGDGDDFADLENFNGMLN